MYHIIKITSYIVLYQFGGLICKVSLDLWMACPLSDTITTI